MSEIENTRGGQELNQESPPGRAMFRWFAKFLAVSLFLLFMGGVFLYLIFPLPREIPKAETFRITIPEGYTVREIGEKFASLGIFSKDEFAKAAQDQEGFLFPDTYEFYKETQPEVVIGRMKENFEKKVSPEILAEIERQQKILRDVIIMASLLEEEVSRTEDRKIISGILWKRFESGSLLQVDAALTYVTGRSSRELSKEDLELVSPYNTYRYPGLPAGPITNPGLEAIEATLYPAESPYWFYLSDQDGKTHYSRTFAEHREKKLKYLR